MSTSVIGFVDNIESFGDFELDQFYDKKDEKNSEIHHRCILSGYLQKYANFIFILIRIILQEH